MDRRRLRDLRDAHRARSAADCAASRAWILTQRRGGDPARVAGRGKSTSRIAESAFDDEVVGAHFESRRPRDRPLAASGEYETRR
jgi:hypothetical protein